MCGAPNCGTNPLLQCSDMARDSKGITQFCLPHTHEPYLPLLLYSPAAWHHRPFCGTYCAYPRRDARLTWPGWLVIYWDKFSRTGSWTPDTDTHPSTNRARRRVTSRPMCYHYAKPPTWGGGVGWIVRRMLAVIVRRFSHCSTAS